MNPNFIMGVYTKNNTKNNNLKTNNTKNNVLIQQLLKIQNQIKNENTNTNVVTMENIKMNQQENKKTFKNILIHVIQKLEDDINKVSQKINQYNKEKKDIMEMNSREIIRLKKLTKKLYFVIQSIYNSMELNKNQKVKLLEKLRKNIESNKIFLQNIQSINDIKSYANTHQNVSNDHINITKTNTNKLNFNQINKNINSLNRNITMNVVENQTSIPNTLNQPVNNTTTIYNLINENQQQEPTQSNTTQTNINKNKNQNKGIINQVMNTMTGIQNNLTKPAGIGNNANKIINTITAPFSESNQTQEEVIEESSQNQNLTVKEKKKKVNMSDKISKMLNQVQPINKSRANSLLNDYLREKTGSSNLKKINLNSNKKNNSISLNTSSNINMSSLNTSSNTSTSNTSFNITSLNTSTENQNKNKNKQNNIFI